jgi:hypothetical protein
MASAPYPTGMKKFLDGDIDLLADNVIALLYDGTFDSSDEFITDLAGTINDRSGNLSGKTTTAGVFDANNETVTTVPISTTDAVIIAKNTGADGTSPLIVFLELSSPFVLGSIADVSIIWNALGIFELAAC